MRKEFLAGASALAFGVLAAAGSASAADLSVVTPPAQLPGSAPIIGWTGFHVGVHGGYALAGADAEFANGAVGARDLTPKGGFAGVQVGYDWQFASGLVAGIEGDWSWAGITDTQTGPGAGPPGIISMQQQITQLASVRGRLGFSSGRWLPYVTAGVAWGTGTRTESLAFNGASTQTHVGWTAGIGAEYALTQKWTVRGEYRYTDLGTKNYAVPGPAGGTNVHLVASSFQLGLNYRF
ncbi:MAG: outer membrane protein [Bauldia sp.]